MHAARYFAADVWTHAQTLALMISICTMIWSDRRFLQAIRKTPVARPPVAPCRLERAPGHTVTGPHSPTWPFGAKRKGCVVSEVASMSGDEDAEAEETWQKIRRLRQT